MAWMVEGEGCWWSVGGRGSEGGHCWLEAIRGRSMVESWTRRRRQHGRGVDGMEGKDSGSLSWVDMERCRGALNQKTGARRWLRLLHISQQTVDAGMAWHSCDTMMSRLLSSRTCVPKFQWPRRHSSQLHRSSSAASTAAQMRSSGSGAAVGGGSGKRLACCCTGRSARPGGAVCRR